MSLKVYLFKYDKLLPIVLLVSNTTSETEQKLYEKYSYAHKFLPYKTNV